MAATWTTQSRNPLNYDAPPPVENVGEAYELLISDTYKLNIGSGYNLTIKPEVTEIVYTTISRSSGSNIWPSITVPEADRFLDIGGEYSLLISDNYKLIIDHKERSTTSWDTMTRNPAQF